MNANVSYNKDDMILSEVVYTIFYIRYKTHYEGVIDGSNHSFETRTGPEGRPGTRPTRDSADPGLGPVRV
jgi:hypothetical protein